MSHYIPSIVLSGPTLSRTFCLIITYIGIETPGARLKISVSAPISSKRSQLASESLTMADFSIIKFNGLGLRVMIMVMHCVNTNRNPYPKPISIPTQTLPKPKSYPNPEFTLPLTHYAP